MKTFSAMWSDKLGEAIKQSALEQCPDGYPIDVKGDAYMYTAIAEAWNQGIDAYLEAITERSTATPDGRFNIHPEELHVLVRRLMESGSEEAESLASGICSTLDIELV